MNEEKQYSGDIAIVGMAGRFPKAASVDEFWRNLCAGSEGISFFTDAELAQAGIPLPLDSSYVKARGVLEEADAFDAEFFGIKPKEAEMMDPQHRVFLECAWAALENAGCDPKKFPGAIGVFAGMSMNTYLASNLASHPELIAMVGDYQTMLGNDKDFLPTRVSYKLNLTGPSLNIQTACSTSLVAVCVACQHLLNHQCDAALAGAVSIRFPQKQGYRHQEGGIASPDGHCRAFDAKAAGTLPGEGTGIVVLKRCEDALANGDTIYAVIKGFATNNDGSNKIGFTAPSVEGQAEVITQAQAMAGIEPASISYIEAHGTGTPLGDPIEIEALTRAFRESTAQKNFCGIGSVKTNIGHLDTAAGVAGLIKTALALHHKKLPASLHFTSPNPRIDFANSPFFVNATLCDWRASATPRRAGVSSFGIGGTNAHVILEEAPTFKPAASSRPAQVLVLSAKTDVALERATANLAQYLKQNSGLELADVAFTLQTGRREFTHRRILIARDVADAATALVSRNPKRIFDRVADEKNSSIAFLFPGQGAQQVNMGRQLYEQEPAFRETVDTCCELLQPQLGFDLRTVLYPATADRAVAADKLTQTSVTQPALFVIEYALAQLWMRWGVKPEAMIGHSIGEYVAACIAGVFSLDDALRIVAERGRLMQEQAPGAMLAVRLSETDLQKLLPDSLSLATVNGVKSCVVSGPREAIESFRQQLANQDIVGTVLATSHAFHSSMMQPALPIFARLLESIELRAPQIPFVSNVTGDWITKEDATNPNYWTRHLRQTVRFADGLAALLKNRDRVLLEVGPGRTLSNFAKQHPDKQSTHAVITSLASGNDELSEYETVLDAVGKLWLAGASIDWTAFHAAEQRHRLPLPSYPFARTRYWVEPAQKNPTAALPANGYAPAPMVKKIPTADSVEQSTRAANGTTQSKDQLIEELRTLLSRLSGLSLAGISDTTTFTEMGFESLFLTQASLAIEKQFGVRIAFRQLLEDANSLFGLADQIVTQLGSTKNTAAPANTNTVSKPSNGHTNLPKQAVEVLAPSRNGAALNVDLNGLLAELEEHEQVVKQTVSLGSLADHFGLEPALNELCSAHICEYFQECGIRLIPGQTHEFAQLQKSLRLRPAYKKFLDYMLRVLAEDNLIVRNDRGFEWTPAASKLSSSTVLRARLLRDFPEFTGVIEMLQHCARNYRQALAGDILGASVLLPDGRHDFLNEHLLPYANRYKSLRRYELLAKTLVVELSRKHPLRILEVGGGGGELTWQIVPELAEPREYLFTDISRTFVNAAAQHAKKFAADFMHFGVLDISRDAAEQGLSLEHYDVVLGLNVVHATAQVEETLAHLRKLLVPGGLLCLVELTRYSRWDTLIIGLAEGWWYFDDAFRTDSPLLGLADWERAFDKAGLPDVFAFPRAREQRAASDAGLIIAQREPKIPVSDRLTRDNASLSSNYRTETNFNFTKSERLPASRERLTAKTLPLTAAQRELWFASQMSEAASCAYNECRLVKLNGTLDIGAVQQALQDLVDRHEALRTRFEADGANQKIFSDSEIEISLIDLSQADERAASAKLEAAQVAEATTPFDLENGPLLRAQLLRFSNSHHVLMLTVHHLVCDGHSFGELLREFAKCYTARAQQQSPAQLPSPVQFSDYARRQSDRCDVSRAREFWLAQFANDVPTLQLPTDQPRSREWTFVGARVVHPLAGTLATALKRLSAEQNCTPFTMFLAAWAILLGRLAGQDEVIVGIPVADRAQDGGESVIGHCTNFLPLRIALKEAGNFSEHLAQVKKLFLNAQEHQQFTFGQLLEHLNLPRHSDRMPLVSVTLNVERRDENLEIPGLTTAVTTNPHTYSNFDLGLNVTESDGNLRLECRYHKGIFAEATIQRWLGHFETLLESITKSPRQKMSELPILSVQQRRQILEDWNNTRVNYDTRSCVHELFEAQVDRTPDAVAAVFNDEQLTYRELNERANAIARRLRALGVGPEVRVGICVERSLDMLTGLLGILKAGGAYVPLDPSYPQERLAFMLKDSGAPVLLTQKTITADFGSALRGLKTLCLDSEKSAPAPDDLFRSVRSENLAYVIYTSGSTGTPKGVAMTHRNVANFFAGMDQLLGKARGVWLAVTSISFDISVLELFWTLARGFTVVIQPDEKRGSISENDHAVGIGENILRHSVTHFQCTPSLMGALLQSANDFAPLRRLEKLLLGGEKLPVPLAEQLRPLVKNLINLYGPTETTVWSAAHFITNAESNIPIGRPLANTSIYILDRNLQPVPAGIVGELFIGGDGVARGYLNQPELTAQKFLEHPFEIEDQRRVYRTGDLARWRADGVIEFLGRRDEQIKLRGHRIEPGEIEFALRRHPAVRDCAVIVREDHGEARLAAYAVCSRRPAADELRNHLEKSLPDYLVPATFTILNTLPLTPNGKLNRRALPSPHAVQSNKHETHEPPRTATEKTVAQIWQELLGIEQIGVHDKFFSLGGHSLLMMRVISRIRDTFQVTLSMRQFFASPTIAGLSSAIEARLTEEIESLSEEEARRLVGAEP